MPSKAAIAARVAWLDHIHECPQCPVHICDEGWELAAKVRASLAPGETWDWR